MPDVPIVDAHVHLWDPASLRLRWLDANQRLNRPFGLADYWSATAGLDVAGLVYLETDVDPVFGLAEADRVARLANDEPRLQGIVAFAPLEYGDRVRAYLDTLVAMSPRIKGVRRIYQDKPLDYCLEPDFVRGVRALPEYGLAFDLCLKHPHLPSTIELVRRCPDTAFIVDHLAKPDIAGGRLDPWREHMRELAGFPHVCCKISGVVTEADHANWTEEDLRPFVLHTLDVFGEDRVVFGSDWPVVLNAAEYRRWVDTLDHLTTGQPAAARRKLWSENARRFYRLP